MNNLGLRLKSAVPAAFLSLCMLPAQGQISSAATMQVMQNRQNAKESSGKEADKLFVKKALEDDLTETQAAHLALQKSASETVKKLAQGVLDDQAKVGGELRALAPIVGAKAPKDPPREDKKLLAKLESLSGEDFDKAYVEYLLKAQQKDADAFRQEALIGDNAQLKETASKDDPLIEAHLHAAQGLSGTAAR